nr:MAG TPA: hypothetical protein [Caudoviricetes sp.]
MHFFTACRFLIAFSFSSIFCTSVFFLTLYIVSA